MGAVLAVCLAMVVGASFFAYKNLYFAGRVVKGQEYLSSVVTGSNAVLCGGAVLRELRI
jgi:hypothetical protein